jgi:hypothetical protein
LVNGGGGADGLGRATELDWVRCVSELDVDSVFGLALGVFSSGFLAI